MPCCGFLAGRPKGPFKQTLVVLRHSERLDHVDPNYKNTPEGKEWPFDTPLTEAGVKLAHSVAEELAELHDEVHFAMVATSPYRRCMQTAAEVAKLLGLKVIIDQEVGEVWEEAMPSEAPPHRTGKDLVKLAEDLQIQVSNPMLPDGGYKLFGKMPKENYPETLEKGHKRMIVRMETYIDQSTQHNQNFIVVSHAPAVAAMTDLFQRGSCDVEKLEYCARVIARREVHQKKPSQGGEQSVYADSWDVTAKGVELGINMDATEEKHQEFCGEVQEMTVKRKDKRTPTDNMFEKSVKAIVDAESQKLDKIAEMKSTASSMSGKGSAK
mmetsp:Transcript_107364/g.309099  ORF Transcript_107364/g.309099 Transcript_107364/m.309099 type:complete len:325 (-) Transcript_107364:33-1007(-)